MGINIQSYATFKKHNEILKGDPVLSLLKHGYCEIFSEWHYPHSDEKPKLKVKKIAESFKKCDIIYHTAYISMNQPCLKVYAK